MKAFLYFGASRDGYTSSIYAPCRAKMARKPHQYSLPHFCCFWASFALLGDVFASFGFLRCFSTLAFCFLRT
jgi:hypothetical protein